MMECLGLDILILILCRLSVQDLIGLKCVSKTFHNLISSPDFIRLHLKKKSSFRAIILNRYAPICLKELGGESSLRAFRTYENIYLNLCKQYGVDSVGTLCSVTSCGSYNGLVCLWPRNNCDKYGDSVLLWNPSLFQAECVPIKRPQQQVHSCWFGYDNDEYKLIIGTDSHIHLIRLYIDVDTWKSSLNINKNYAHFNVNATGTLVHRTVHWPAYYELDSKYTIISYDLSNETVGSIATPDVILINVSGVSGGFVLGQVDGCLSILFTRFCSSELWVMKEYGVRESWTKSMKISSTFYLERKPYAVELDDPADLHSPVYGINFYVESLISPRSVKIEMC